MAWLRFCLAITRQRKALLLYVTAVWSVSVFVGSHVDQDATCYIPLYSTRNFIARTSPQQPVFRHAQEQPRQKHTNMRFCFNGAVIHNSPKLIHLSFEEQKYPPCAGQSGIHVPEICCRFEIQFGGLNDLRSDFLCSNWSSPRFGLFFFHVRDVWNP